MLRYNDGNVRARLGVPRTVVKTYIYTHATKRHNNVHVANVDQLFF